MIPDAMASALTMSHTTDLESDTPTLNLHKASENLPCKSTVTTQHSNRYHISLYSSHHQISLQFPRIPQIHSISSYPTQPCISPPPPPHPRHHHHHSPFSLLYSRRKLTNMLLFLSAELRKGMDPAISRLRKQPPEPRMLGRQQRIIIPLR